MSGEENGFAFFPEAQNQLVGEAGAQVAGRTAVSAAHHVLLDLEQEHPNLQRWYKDDGYPCDTGDTVPVP